MIALAVLLEGPLQFEGNFSWLYQDGDGRPTVGVGCRVFDEDQAAEMPWVDAAGGPVSPDEIRAQYRAVAAAPHGNYSAMYYHQFTTMRLSDVSVMALAQDRLNRFMPGLRRLLPEFDSFPVPAQAALIDMAWKMGIGKPGVSGLAMFTNLLAACEAGDWMKAARSCHVARERQDRYEWRMGKFGAAHAASIV